MSYSISVLAHRKIALFRFEGRVTVKEAKEAFLSYVARPDFDPDFVMLSDARRVSAIDASFTQILTNIYGLSKPLSKFPSEALSVVLVSDDMVFGMARMLEQVLDFLSKIKLVITETETDALARCDVSDVSIDALWDEAQAASQAPI